MHKHLNLLSKNQSKLGLFFAFILIGVFLVLLLTLGSYYLIRPYEKYIVGTDSNTGAEVGLVLGAGIAQNGKPYDELKARLDSAAEALEAGQVSKLILSGDNRFEAYDEPTAMLKYLVEEKDVPEDRLQRDFAGRSTYESCERTKKVFKVNKVIIYSASSHLPRAIYLCRHFGIEAYGISSGVEANNSFRRELLARIKAVYNAKFIGEPTLLGQAIPLD